MIVLNLQFWEGDKAQAMALARLIADLEPKKRSDALFMFSARFDCEHDDETIEYVSEKFPTYRYTTKREARGWPNGPNQMVGDTYEHIVERWRRKLLPVEIDSILFMEADCVPLSPTWIDQLYAEFKGCGKKVLGAWLTKDDCGAIEHVNGNCVVSLDFWRKAPAMFHPPSRWGWDAALTHVIMPNAAPSKLIWSDYQLGMAHNPWKGDEYLWDPKTYRSKANPLFGETLQPVWHHGGKTMDSINAVRKRFLEKK